MRATGIKPLPFLLHGVRERIQGGSLTVHSTQLYEKLTVFGRSGWIQNVNPNIEVILVPRQKKGLTESINQIRTEMTIETVSFLLFILFWPEKMNHTHKDSGFSFHASKGILGLILTCFVPF